MMQYENKLTGAIIEVADGMTVSGENWEEFKPAAVTDEDDENGEAEDKKPGKKKQG